MNARKAMIIVRDVDAMCRPSLLPAAAASPHAHDFLVLVFVEQGAGSYVVDGVERPLRTGEVHALSPGQVIGVSAIAEMARCRAWSVAFTPDAVPTLAAVSPLAWAHHPLLALFTPGAGPGLVAEPDRSRWSAWLAELS